MYNGLPNSILTDQGSQAGEIFVHMACESDIDVGRTDVEEH